MSMLITTHEMNFAKHVSNKVVFMEKGEIVEQGSPVNSLTMPKKSGHVTLFKN